MTMVTPILLPNESYSDYHNIHNIQLISHSYPINITLMCHSYPIHIRYILLHLFVSIAIIRGLKANFADELAQVLQRSEGGPGTAQCCNHGGSTNVCTTNGNNICTIYLY